MKFVVSRNALVNSLNKVARAVSYKTPVPALTGIKIEANANGLTLTGSDSDITIQTFIANDSDLLNITSVGVAILSAKYITEIVRKMDDDEIAIEIIDGLLVKIFSAKSEFKLNSINPYDYPRIDLNKDGEMLSINAFEFKKLVSQTTFATNTSESRPVLTAVNFKAHNNKLECVATDSYRLAKKIINLDNNKNFNINIPARSLNEIAKIIEKDENINICVSDKKVLFEFENSIIQTRLIDGSFPDTTNLIPNDFSRELTLDSRDLINAIDRASLLTSDVNNIVKLSIDTLDDIMLSSKSQEIGSVEEHLKAIDYKGDPIIISFSSKYVNEAIKAFDGGELVVYFIGEMKPFIIKDVKDTSIIQLILPVKTY